MEINIPTVGTTGTTGTKGANANDYKKFVIVDTHGNIVEEGGVLNAMDIIKDENLEAKEQFFKELFSMVGLEFKERESVKKTVKKVSPSELLAKFNKGN